MARVLNVFKKETICMARRWMVSTAWLCSLVIIRTGGLASTVSSAWSSVSWVHRVNFAEFWTSCFRLFVNILFVGGK